MTHAAMPCGEADVATGIAAGAEAVLARELGLCYATLALVTDLHGCTHATWMDGLELP